MPVDTGALNYLSRTFTPPDPQELEQNRYQNALLKSAAQEAPARSQLLQAEIQQRQLVNQGLQGKLADSDKNEVGLAYAAIAADPHPLEAAKRALANPRFVQLSKSVGVPLHPNGITAQDTDESIGAEAAQIARSAGVQLPARFETLGDINNPRQGVYQRNAQTGQLAQVTAPTGITPYQEEELKIQRDRLAAEQGDPQNVEATAQLIYKGQMPMLSGIVLKTPYGQQVANRVAELSRQGEAGGANPYSAGDFQSRAKAMRDFNTGQQGNSVRFMNTAIAHINTLQQLGQDLDNQPTQAINRLKNAWRTQTGQQAPTSFEAARDIVANEVVKAVTASGGALADRQEAQQQITSASSWSQLAGVADTWKQLLAGQLGSLRLQYEQGTGLKDFDKKLYPETLKELGNRETAAPPSGPRKEAPPGALAYLKQHPELSEQFKAKYGYLP